MQDHFFLWQQNHVKKIYGKYFVARISLSFEGSENHTNSWDIMYFDWNVDNRSKNENYKIMLKNESARICWFWGQNLRDSKCHQGLNLQPQGEGNWTGSFLFQETLENKLSFKRFYQKKAEVKSLWQPVAKMLKQKVALSKLLQKYEGKKKGGYSEIYMTTYNGIKLIKCLILLLKRVLEFWMMPRKFDEL